jgi:hypothetical protein
MLEDGIHLLPGHAGKPIEEFSHRRAIFEIFEQRRYRHPRALEQPRTTDLARHTFYGSTCIPIQHGLTLTPNLTIAKRGIVSSRNARSRRFCV